MQDPSGFPFLSVAGQRGEGGEAVGKKDEEADASGIQDLVTDGL